MVIYIKKAISMAEFETISRDPYIEILREF